MATPVPLFTAIPPFPALSDRADGSYNNKAFAFGTHMADTFVEEVNAFAASVNSFAAGGAYAFPYVFDPTTADADPGPGGLRLGSAPQNAATALRIDSVTVGGTNIDSLLAAIGAGTSVLKGAIRIVEVGAPANWMLFDILAVSAASGYRNMTVVPRASSSANPFSSGAPVMIFIDRAGDVGNGAEVLLGGADITEPTALINFLSIFSPLYDNYTIELNGVTLSNNNAICIRLANAGAASSATAYTTPGGHGTEQTVMDTRWTIGNYLSASPRVGTIEISNANGIATPKGYRYSGSTQGLNGSSATVYRAALEVALYTGNHAASGFQISLYNAGNFTGGKIRIYGKRN